ncbi:hypothetical protein B0I37DRAFT_405604 [Chaetomium sp. MPI-CAGE-AT-0009]|nr:hypothetical protein B0I37DRAFT_405604 [Chaetomium sp. MPI-CAGE-AT-0009]
MASKKYQAQRRILCKRRKQAKRAAEIASRTAQTGESTKTSKDASEKAAPQVKSELAGQKAPAPAPSSKPTKPKATGSESKRGVKMIGLRERVRLLEKMLVWMAERGIREMKQRRKRVQKLEQEILLLQADVAATRRGW